MDDYKPISPKELERGYFFVTHRLLINKILFIASIVILAIFYIFIIFKVVAYISSPGFDSMALEINQSKFDWASYHSSRAPQELVMETPEFTSLGDRRYNIMAMVENPNEDWAIVSMDYHFVSQGEDTENRTTFLNPGEKRLVTLTAYQSDKAIRNPQLVISNIKWRRVDNSFPQINIEVSNIKFQAAVRETVDGVTTQLPSRVSWQAFNNSVYNFWEVSWQIALYNGDKIVAYNEANTRDFLALDSRELETVWLTDLPRVTRAAIFPVLNKLDTDIFKDIYVAPSIDNR